ncbi:decaprenyl-phosphate phosphoribosyltransferase [Nitrolancea hollandica]|uniref:UbiA prenyltransferase n=1 Tax=Nitrolancea hollandica Lb TaxID=1129897 RepID=I4ECM8_9BACT|nr:decaprenyl-phosphate phosphoribosyltransferase [Nitrolancea hollandica]CCF82440.1 UbiA prenyltransferase [Nitrolancea hollandica Lb]
MRTSEEPRQRDGTPFGVNSPSQSRAAWTGMQGVAPLIQAMRPKQWTKNTVVFAALVFNGQLLSLSALPAVIATLILFSMTSSAVYLFNDLLDIDADRHHPLKRNRPIASGRISTQTAWLAIAGLLLLVFPSAFALRPQLAAVLSVYILVMLAYTYVLKHWVIIDVFVIAAGFVLRAVAGAVVIDVPISPWLYVCTILLSLFIGFAKRRHELVLLDNNAAAHRKNLDQYSAAFLDTLIAVVAGATIMAYSLYTFSAPNLPENHAMMATIPFVLYGTFRYLYLVHRKNGGGAPEQVLLDDLPLLGCIVLWVLVATVVLYSS